MADRYLLESGAPDGYLLEDGSGVLLLETPVVNITYLNDGHVTTNQTTYTFAGVSFGAEAEDRILIACVTSYGIDGAALSDITGCTIGGSAATELINVGGGTSVGHAIYAREVPTGASGDVVFTVSPGGGGASYVLYRMVGGKITPFATYSNLTESTASVSIDVPAEGGAIGSLSSRDNASSAYTGTWAGLTEDFENNVTESTFARLHTGAHDNFASAQDNLTVSLTPSTTVDENTLLVVVFGNISATLSITLAALTLDGDGTVEAAAAKAIIFNQALVAYLPILVR